MRDLRPLRDLRRAPRVDVLLRIRGRLLPIEQPIVIVNLSRSGFAILSESPFETGQVLNFRLTGDNGVSVNVTAEAVHYRANPTGRGKYLTGFRFIPGRLTGIVPKAVIDELIDAIVPVESLI